MRQSLVILALSVTAPALAETPSLRGGAAIECYCTDSQGARIDLLGETCLFVDGRAYMARCEMSLNVPMWRDTGRACLSSSLIGVEPVHPARDPRGVDAHVAFAKDQM